MQVPSYAGRDRDALLKLAEVTASEWMPRGALLEGGPLPDENSIMCMRSRRLLLTGVAVSMKTCLRWPGVADRGSGILARALPGDAWISEVVGLVDDDGVGALGDLPDLVLRSPAGQVGVVEEGQAREVPSARSGMNGGGWQSRPVARRLGDEQDDILLP